MKYKVTVTETYEKAWIVEASCEDEARLLYDTEGGDLEYSTCIDHCIETVERLCECERKLVDGQKYCDECLEILVDREKTIIRDEIRREGER